MINIAKQKSDNSPKRVTNEDLPLISRTLSKFPIKYTLKPRLNQATLMLRDFGSYSKIRENRKIVRQEEKEKLDGIFQNLYTRKTIKDMIRYNEIVNKNDDHSQLFKLALTEPKAKIPRSSNMPKLRNLKTTRTIQKKPEPTHIVKHRANFQLEQNKVIRDAKVENTVAKRARRLLKSKVTRILNDCLPILQKEYLKHDEEQELVRPKILETRCRY
jgi:hypothetical protein